MAARRQEAPRNLELVNNEAGELTSTGTRSGLLWSATSAGGQSILQIVVLLILARLLAPAEFGIASATMVICSLGIVFSKLGIGQSIVQRPTLEDAHIDSGFILSILLGASIGMLLFIGAESIAGIFRMPELVPFVQLTSAIFPIVGLSIVAESLLTRELRFRTLAVVDLVAYLLGYGVVAILLSLLKYGALALVIGSTAHICLRTVFILCARPQPLRFKLSLSASKELLYFGGGQTLGRIGSFVALEVDNFVVARWLGAEALGLYSRAYKFAMLPATIIGTALDRVLFPVMSRLQQDPAFLWSWFRRGSVGLAIGISPSSAVIIVLAPEIVEVALGRPWMAMTVPFQILCLAAPFRASTKMSDSLARATAAVYRRAWRQAIYAACVIAAAWLGQRWGISGVAVGVLCAIMANFVLMTQLSISLVKGTWRTFLVSHWPVLVVSLAFALPAFGLAAILRSMQYPAAVVLLSVAASAAAGALALVVSRPRLLLGADGVWLLNTIRWPSGSRPPAVPDEQPL